VNDEQVPHPMHATRRDGPMQARSDSHAFGVEGEARTQATCEYDDTRTRSCGSSYLHTRRSLIYSVRVMQLQVPVLADF
jgi:hypothetical protein